MNFLITFGFICLDFASGMLKALSKKSLASTKMREGLFHKVALLLCMVLGYAVDFAQGYLDLGFHVPVGASICVYIVLMEVFSILENICEINPELAPDRLLAIFGKVPEKKEQEE